MPIAISIPAEPTAADREAILQPLLAFNQASGARPDYAPIAIMLKDTDGGASLGGLWGQLYYDWLFVELLFVAEPARRQGFGTKLVAAAEAIARQQGCVGVWLDSFSFQAPGFYLKQGFEAFGTLDDYPIGRKRVFFRKRLRGG